MFYKNSFIVILYSHWFWNVHKCIKPFDTCITVAKWWHGIYHPLINFKTFIYFSWDKKLMNILAITSRAFYIQQCFLQACFFTSLSPKTSEHCSHIGHKSSQKTSVGILPWIIRFTDMSSFLLAGVTSILWTALNFRGRCSKFLRI